MATKKINTDITSIDDTNSPYTIVITTTILKCDATNSAITATLPSVAGKEGKKYVIVKTDSSANNVTIQADGSELINGSADFSLSSQWEVVTLYSTGSEWVKI